MNRTRIGAVTPGARYRISGFVENLRNKKKMAFLVIRDISGKLQVTVEKEKNAELAALVDQLTLDSVVTVEGEVVANEYVKMGGMEMLPDTLRIESVAEALPIQDDSDIDARMDYRWIDLRREQNQLMLRLQTTLTAALREFLLEREFVEIHTPKLIAADLDDALLAGRDARDAHRRHHGLRAAAEHTEHLDVRHMPVDLFRDHQLGFVQQTCHRAALVQQLDDLFPDDGIVAAENCRAAGL